MGSASAPSAPRATPLAALLLLLLITFTRSLAHGPSLSAREDVDCFDRSRDFSDSSRSRGVELLVDQEDDADVRRHVDQVGRQSLVEALQPLDPGGERRSADEDG